MSRSPARRGPSSLSACSSARASTIPTRRRRSRTATAATGTLPLSLQSRCSAVCGSPKGRPSRVRLVLEERDLVRAQVEGAGRRERCARAEAGQGAEAEVGLRLEEGDFLRPQGEGARGADGRARRVRDRAHRRVRPGAGAGAASGGRARARAGARARTRRGIAAAADDRRLRLADAELRPEPDSGRHARDPGAEGRASAPRDAAPAARPGLGRRARADPAPGARCRGAGRRAVREGTAVLEEGAVALTRVEGAEGREAAERAEGEEGQGAEAAEGRQGAEGGEAAALEARAQLRQAQGREGAEGREAAEGREGSEAEEAEGRQGPGWEGRRRRSEDRRLAGRSRARVERRLAAALADRARAPP